MAVGGCILYFIVQPKLKVTQEINQSILEQNDQLKIEKATLKTEVLHQEQILKNIKQQIQDIGEQLEVSKKLAAETAESFYKEKIALATERFNQALELEGQKFQQSADAFQSELQHLQEDGARNFALQMEEWGRQSASFKANLDLLQAAVVAATDAAKRQEEIRTKSKFYQIQISDVDLSEIKALRTAAKGLRNQEPLNKVIWKFYYEKPTSDLIGRVVGLTPCSGIYKITNTENQMCYVGQAVDIANRWKQHIRRGLGAETPTRNKLYPAMQATGPEGFTFEVIEKCDRALLDEREDFWQDYFKAKEFGYSIK